MDLNKRLCHALGMLALFLTTGYATAQTLVVVADTWCPYNCEPTAKKPGYVVELLKSAFATKGQSVSYRVMPWTRALLDTHSGKAAAVIAANAREAAEHQLAIGSEPIGVAKGCVFVPGSSPFKYRSIQDLDGLTRVGVVGGNAYQNDFGEWLSRPENRPKTHEVFADNPSERRAEMMTRGRLDGIFEDYTEMAYVLSAKGLQNQIVSAGCQSPSPLYVGFSKKHPHAQDLVATLDMEIRRMRKVGSLKDLLMSYGLEDWK